MFEHKVLQNLNDYFNDFNNRPEKGVYFYRINGYSEEVKKFILKYYEAARLSGVVIEGKIPNPDEKNLSYYNEIMGKDFKKDVGFIIEGLKKWLPRMNDYQRQNVALSIYDTLERMTEEGKNDNMIKNAYIKFMCWLYYKFERIVSQLGENKIPKILYEGDISNYELKLISILSKAGCDVVLLQYNGDGTYLKSDPESKLSYSLNINGLVRFPENFNVKFIRKEIENRLNRERIYQASPEVSNCTNAWIDGNGFDDFKKEIKDRGDSDKFFYNCFYKINGVEDKLTYLSELYQFQLDIKNSKRQILIIEKEIPKPTIDEINLINRRKYNSKEQMLTDLSNNIEYSANIELQRIISKAFIDILLEEAENGNMNLNKLTNKAVYLLCWLNRYKSKLFSNWKMPDISCFIYLGGCKDDGEALFVRFLARLPIDVIVLNPDLNFDCCLRDNLLYEVNYENSLRVDKFPGENSDSRIGTAAYQAERELDDIIYQDSGIYRNRQYNKASSITLQTTYEEISILWDQEVKYRPNFSINNSVVNIPVIFSKVSGIKEGDISKYWSSVKSLITDDTFVIRDAPFINSSEVNPIKAFAVEFFKNGRLRKDKIKAHRCYQYDFLREDIQNHILDKLQSLIERKNIKGTFENGTEYTIIATVLNIKKDIVRKIQNFDFTRKNPKIIYINTTENIISLEDSILIAFLNLVGFDIVFFVPTGYMCVEKYFNKQIIEEHQIGEYAYDLRIPNLSTVSSSLRHSWRDIIFKRGG
ncbi:MAG: hypothetical protein HFE59_05570 [Clostridiales bacterium]|nr:hypothetical protein [Clostridiales bacterium]